VKLTTGQTYDVSALQCTGWTGDAEGYNYHDYFDAAGRYLGPDADGVEPEFEEPSA